MQSQKRYLVFMLDIGEDMGMGSSEHDLSWKPIDGALPLSSFPSDEQLDAFRERLPDEEHNGYKIKELIPTREVISKIQNSPHALEGDDGANLLDLVYAAFWYSVDRKHDVHYEIDADGLHGSVVHGDYWARNLDNDMANDMANVVKRYISKKEWIQPFKTVDEG